MFTDIVDSTRLMASAGNAVWMVLLAEHHRIVRSTVARFGGSVMTSTGDGFSAWFERPADAIAAAGALHEALEVAMLSVPGGVVRVRIGLSSGPVFDIGADVSGMAVAEAARVMSTAGPCQTHVSQSVLDHGLDPSGVVPIGSFDLKGLPSPIEIYSSAVRSGS
jgi:class 3 adenylate cyclase